MALRHETDVSLADWFARGGDDWWQLCTIGPSGFAAYARVLLSVEQGEVEHDPTEHVFRTLCSVLARHTSTADDCFFGLWEGLGEINASLMTQFVEGGESRSWTVPPAFGRAVMGGPKVVIPNRSYLQFRGPLDDVGRWPVPDEGWLVEPSLVWPADHAWFAATDTDLVWTGVGGSEELIRELLDTPGLVVRRARPTDPPDPDD
jgi:hypothetical protein